MPRIAVTASTAPVRFRPLITKVENTYIIPPAAALAMAAMEVRMTKGLIRMLNSQLAIAETIHRLPSGVHTRTSTR
jgi:hypothetical protein